MGAINGWRENVELIELERARSKCIGVDINTFMGRSQPRYSPVVPVVFDRDDYKERELPAVRSFPPLLARGSVLVVSSKYGE